MICNFDQPVNELVDQCHLGRGALRHRRAGKHASEQSGEMASKHLVRITRVQGLQQRVHALGAVENPSQRLRHYRVVQPGVKVILWF
jgi:hypothetical protein